ncbi:hypothetical protein AVEN_45989-1 [Araneus ventricosus]|uniref:Uncharacterized protein n=1 Tax=Araneus ventricosus TaxID=182803 RepID=A0A4Y2F8D3_ARAVE|nr:hypothetical protein AVEN_45989-1 [Araneus ventricosus]
MNTSKSTTCKQVNRYIAKRTEASGGVQSCFNPSWDSFPRNEVSALEPEGTRYGTPFSLRSTVYVGLMRVKFVAEGHTFSRLCGVEVWRGGAGLSVVFAF